MPPFMKMTTTAKAEKGSFRKNIGKLVRYCKREWIWMALTIVLGVAAAVLQIIGPNKMGDITNLIYAGFMGDRDALVSAVTDIAIFLVIIYAAGALLSYAQSYITSTVTQRIGKRMRDDINGKINRLPLNYFDTHLHGDVLSRVTNDVDTISQSLNQSLASLFSNVILFGGVLIMMFVTQWIMALTVIVTTILGFSFSAIFMSKAQKYFNQNQSNLADVNSHIEEIYSGHNVVQLFNAKEHTGREFARLNKKLFVSGWKSQFISGIMQPLMGFVGNFGYVAVCVVGAILTLKGKIELGVITSFMIYVRLFSNPLAQIAQCLTSLQSASAASGRVFEFFEAEEMLDEKDKTLVLENVEGNIDFEHVKFGYDENKIIINDFSAKIKAGAKVAIVGPTGAGKTTLVNLLMRFYEMNDGDIKIDGVSVKDITRGNLHQLFGMVLQDTWLFEGTIKENLRYNKPDVTDEQIAEVCKKVGIDHFIQTLSKGYDTVIDDACNLSAGQKQLLTIARTMIENSPMMILDEATSSVDTRTEVLLQNAMDKAMEGRTSFIIAHRLSTIKNADVILVLKDGDIVEKGNHKTLLAKGGFYADIYNAQFAN